MIESMQTSFPTLRRPFAPLLALALLAATAFGTAAFTASEAEATTYTLTMVTWSGATGTLGSVSVTASGATVQSNNPFQSSDFDPIGTGTGVGNNGTSAMTFSFGAPLSDPLIYLADVRTTANGGAQSYSFTTTGGTCSWSVKSGLTYAVLSGSTLTVPSGPNSGTVYTDDGIVRCTGTVSGVTITPSTLGSGPSTYYSVGQLTAVPDATTTSTAPTDPVTPTFTG